MNFKYKGIGSSGIVEGTRDSADKFSSAREMKVEGITLVSVEPILNSGSKKSVLAFFDNLFSIKLKDKIMFAGNLSSMISAGLSLSRALSVLEKQSSNKRLKKIISIISEKVNKGESLSSALESFGGIFPRVFTAMVAAGEEAGKLSESLKIVSEQLNKTYELKRKVKGAMINPTVIIIVIIIIAALMMIFLVPTLTAVFEEMNVELPLSTKLVIGISKFMSGYYWVVLIFIALLGTGSVKFAKSDRGRRLLHYIILKLPLIGETSRQVNSAVTMRTISSLISAGVSMIDALTITGQVVQNVYYKKVLFTAAGDIGKGKNLSSIFEANPRLYPVFVSEMAEVGEETGNLPDLLLKGAIFYEGEVDQITKNLSTVIEPVLMVIIGGAVGFFVLAMISPMYSLTSAF